AVCAVPRIARQAANPRRSPPPGDGSRSNFVAGVEGGTGMNTWLIILTGMLVAGACSIVGCFLVLRRMAMIGDAISHSVLPGIVIAFLFSGSRGSVWMMLGAAVIG